MEDLLTADKLLDCRGLLCPMPLVKTTRAIKEIQVGQVLEAKDRGRESRKGRNRRWKR